MAPSPLYAKLLSLSETFAVTNPFASRTPDATHGWGHNYLVSRNPCLQGALDNDTFRAHCMSTGRLLDANEVEVHDIIIDEHKRKSSIRMSYHLKAHGQEEVVPNDLIWLLTFTGEGEVEGGVDGILIKDSIEFIDAAASGRVGRLIKDIHGENLPEDVRGGVAIVL